MTVQAPTNPEKQLWTTRLDSTRRKTQSEGKAKEVDTSKDEKAFMQDTRTEIERDFDRILFSTPARRLADKTQVFPLDKNDSVRNRLTHSYEVSNLARSFGVALCYSDQNPFFDVPNAQRDVPSLLAAIGLVHDLGNPPFGHQGEAAIQHWFRKNEAKICNGVDEQDRAQFKSLFKDFSLFEGNAQGFRLVTRLQVLDSTFGLDLTYACLAAMMKYPTSSAEIDGALAAKKKHGFFRSEEEIAKEVLSKVGLSVGKRHALAYVMEACDDIAYVVLDAEDSVKKGLASFPDLIAFLRHNSERDHLIEQVAGQGERKHNDYRNAANLSPAELNDISMQRFRVFAIGAMIRSAIKAFHDNKKTLLDGTQPKPLLALSTAEKLRQVLKQFSLTHGYTHKSVLALELQGFNTIRGLLDMLWFSIDQMAGKDAKAQQNQHPFAKYVYTRISENYRRTFEFARADNKLPLWYHKCQLLTDMVSGMTDSFALSLYEELKGLQGDCVLESPNG